MRTNSQALACLITALATTVATIGHTQPPVTVPEAAENEFHFVVLGDAQFDDPPAFNRIIDQTVLLDPAFVIQVGDLIEGYQSDLGNIDAEWQRFKKQIAPLGDIPFLPIAGNHDIFGGDKRPDSQLEARFEKTMGPLYFSFEYRNTLIVGLNSDSSEGINRITGNQWTWLVKTLEASDARHKMLFMHRPAFLLRNADNLHALAQRTGVEHIFYGHHHHYHHFERDGVKYTMTNTSGDSVSTEEQVGGFDHLLQVSVRDDDVRVAVIKADSIKPQNAVVPEDNYDFFALSQRLVRDTVLLKKLGKHRYSMELALNNRSDRDVQALVSCYSDDDRWSFEPAKIPPVILSSKSTAQVDLTLSFSASRQPESDPRCTVKVPYQTAQGTWIEMLKTVTGQQDR